MKGKLFMLLGAILLLMGCGTLNNTETVDKSSEQLIKEEKVVEIPSSSVASVDAQESSDTHEATTESSSESDTSQSVDMGTLYKPSDYTGVTEPMEPLEGYDYNSEPYLTYAANFKNTLQYTDGYVFQCPFETCADLFSTLMSVYDYTVEKIEDATEEYPYRVIVIFDGYDYYVITESIEHDLLVIPADDYNGDTTPYKFNLQPLR